MRILVIFCFMTPLFGGLSLTEIKSKLDSGMEEAQLAPILQQEGIDFPIDLSHLKQMKKMDFPDYAIDLMVELYGPQPNRSHFSSTSSYYDGPGIGPGYMYQSPYFYPYSPYLSFYSSYYLWSLPGFYFSYIGYPLYYDYYRYSSLWYAYYWNPAFSGIGAVTIPGNRLSPLGFSNSSPERIKGHARSRSGSRKVKSRVKSAFSSSSSGSRSYSGSGVSSRSSSSSSGSRAVHK